MEERPRPPEAAPASPWRAEPDEGYWQAVLEQGEIAPDSAPPAEFEFLAPCAGPGDSEPQSLTEPFSTVTDGSTGCQDRPTSCWDTAELALERADVFELRVTGVNRGGLLVPWNGLQGFIPTSHLLEAPRSRGFGGRLEELTGRIGELLSVRLIEVDRQQGRLVFSERAATSDAGAAEGILKSIRPGDVRRGAVTSLTPFGAFVDLGGIEGLVHISELSWDRVRHPGDVVQPGDRLDVCVLGVNQEEKHIALSLKRLQPNPWYDVGSRYRAGQVVQGVVTSVVSFGAFVRVEAGLEGLVHISELGDGSFVHPGQVVREGESVFVRVLNVDAANQRMGLSLRQAQGGSRHE